MKNHKFLLMALVLSTLFPSACQKSHKRPNIVVIVVDALRVDHLPFYGYSKDTAPFLSQLSRHSSVFVHSYAASNWTVPCVGSLLTSLYPFQHRLNEGIPARADVEGHNKHFAVGAMSDSVITMAEIFKSSGYHTFGISSSFFVSTERGYSQGFEYFCKFRMKTDAEALHAKLAEWEGEMRKAPYFLYLHYTDVHIPYQRRAPWYQPEKDKRDDIISAYDSNIPYVDAKIEELYRRMNWGQNTILVVTADHGEELWEHGHRGHNRNLFNTTLRVPLLIYLPGDSRTGRRIEPNVSAIDILPTLCDYIGRKPDPQLEGLSLLPAMRGKAEYLVGRPIYAYAECGDRRFRGILRDNWKLIMTPGGDKFFLFDLNTDPGEKRNLANKAQASDRKLEMARQYWDFEKNSRKYEKKMVDLEYTRKQIQELKTLGYIH
jgi:arylsulfatase A-like enzyme